MACQTCFGLSEVELLVAYKLMLRRKEIAARLNISMNTLKVHITAIYNKTGSSTGTEALLKLIEAGHKVLMPSNESSDKILD